MNYIPSTKLKTKNIFLLWESCAKKRDNIPVSIDIVAHIRYVVHKLEELPKKIAKITYFSVAPKSFYQVSLYTITQSETDVEG